MGRCGRIIMVAGPLVLSMATLICIIIVGAGGRVTSEESSTGVYFMRADMSNFTSSTSSTSGYESTFESIASTIDSDTDSSLLEALESTSSNVTIADFYNVYLWNYCAGNFTTDGEYDVGSCSTPKAFFWFNPVDVWGLNSTAATKLFGDKLTTALETYENVSKFMFMAFAVSFFSTLATLVVGISALFSRWGSFFTSCCAAASFLSLLAFAITSTILFSTLAGAMETVLADYDITASIGGNMMRTIWTGLAFSLFALSLWTFSICCCSGKSPYNHRGNAANNRPLGGPARVEKTPYNYERVGSSHGAAPPPAYANDDIKTEMPQVPSAVASQSPKTAYDRSNTGYRPEAVPMQDLHFDDKTPSSTAYEPFRHEQANHNTDNSPYSPKQFDYGHDTSRQYQNYAPSPTHGSFPYGDNNSNQHGSNPYGDNRDDHYYSQNTGYNNYSNHGHGDHGYGR